MAAIKWEGFRQIQFLLCLVIKNRNSKFTFRQTVGGGVNLLFWFFRTSLFLGEMDNFTKGGGHLMTTTAIENNRSATTCISDGNHLFEKYVYSLAKKSSFSDFM